MPVFSDLDQEQELTGLSRFMIYWFIETTIIKSRFMTSSKIVGTGLVTVMARTVHPL